MRPLAPLRRKGRPVRPAGMLPDAEMRIGGDPYFRKSGTRSIDSASLCLAKDPECVQQIQEGPQIWFRRNLLASLNLLENGEGRWREVYSPISTHGRHFATATAQSMVTAAEGALMVISACRASRLPAGPQAAIMAC